MASQYKASFGESEKVYLSRAFIMVNKGKSNLCCDTSLHPKTPKQVKKSYFDSTPKLSQIKSLLPRFRKIDVTAFAS